MMNEIQVKRTQSNKGQLLRPARRGPENSTAEHAIGPVPVGLRPLGNQAVQRMLRSGIIQAKLVVNEPGDKYEQEADRIAEQVMSMPEPAAQKQVQRACPECEEEVQRQPEEEEEEKIQAKPIAEQITPLVLRQTEPDKEEEETVQAQRDEVQRQEEPEEEEVAVQKKGPGGGAVGRGLEAQIRSLKGSGQPLSPHVRGFFEPRFGQDFGQVRVHTDARAAEAARAVNARAFTVGRNVVLGEEEYVPETVAGRRLLAHELTHIIQQKSLRIEGNRVQRERQRGSRFITDIFVHLTSQTVDWRYSDGESSNSHPCSTGAGLCNIENDNSNRENSALTPIGGPFPVCHKGHSRYSDWVEFNCCRHIALHYYQHVDGCPWSHGCVRLHSDAAHLIFSGARVNSTHVHVSGTPNLKRCWTDPEHGNCHIRGTTRKCRRGDCEVQGDFPLPDESQTATRIA
ncbi:MAG: DUF4157 domain-containing protein [Methanothrix sp.]|nr:DUF4157 domain-containing protein [Methanothrix sp.]